MGNQKRFKTITIASSNGKTKNILINIKSLLSRTFLTKNQIQSLSTKELSLLLSSRITDAIHPKKLSRLFPNSILISLKDKQERRDSLNTHLKSIGQSLNFHHLEAVYGKNLPQELQIKMSNSSSAIKENREDYKGRMGCFMSQLNAVKLAKEKQYPFVLICEDDVRFMPDKVCSSYLEKGLKELPKDWEICFLGYYEADKKNVKNFSDHLVMPSVPYDNHAYLVNACMYDKLIETYENELKKNNHQMRACDVVLAEELTRGCKTFAFKENVAIQNEGESSIVNTVVYGNYQKELSELRKKFKNDDFVNNDSKTSDGFPVISPLVAGALYQMAHHATEIFNKHGIRFWADGGTILGQERHEGLIPWDDDIDFAIHPEDASKIKNPQVVEDLKSVGLEVVDHWLGAKIQPIENHPEGCSHKKEGYVFKTPNIDLFFTEKTQIEGKEAYRYSKPKAKETWPSWYYLQEEVFEKDGTILQKDFGPTKINTVSNPNQIINRLYGENCLLEAYQQYDHIHEKGLKKILKKLTDFRPPAFKIWDKLSPL